MNDDLNLNDKETVSNADDISISVFLPCHNEQENIEDLVKQTISVLEKLNADYELIIVNDGSKDDTGEIAEKLSKKNQRIKVVHHQTNLGYGSALQSGFKAATKALVFYTDGDGQFDIKELPDIIPLIKECDIVSCYRIKRQEGLLRKFNAFCWTKLVSLLFQLKVRDIDCAFKLYKRKIFNEIEMSSTGALIDTEILARALRCGYKIKQHGVNHYPRRAGTQSGANIAVILRAFKELFKLYNQIRKDKK